MAAAWPIPSNRRRPARARLRQPRRAGRADPVVRHSEHADAQANGALPLAKALGRPPREVAEEVVALAGEALARVCYGGDRRPGLPQPDASTTPSSRSEAAAVSADERLGLRPVRHAPRPSSSTTRRPTWPRRCTSATCAPRSSATPWCGCSRPLGHHVIRENHIGDWGTPVRHAHRAPARPRRGRGRPTSSRSATSTASTRQARREVRRPTRSSRTGPASGWWRCRRGDPETLRLWRLLVGESTRYFDEVYRRLGRAARADDDLAGESAYNDRAARRRRRGSTRPGC